MYSVYVNTEGERMDLFGVYATAEEACTVATAQLVNWRRVEIMEAQG